jgi:uncharacterized membrane protein YoaK (UPF0700 family)
MLYASLILLSFVAGLVDVASLLGMGHIFIANMTGSIVFMALAASGVPQFSFVRSAVSLTAVLVGSGIADYVLTPLIPTVVSV